MKSKPSLIRLLPLLVLITAGATQLHAADQTAAPLTATVYDFAGDAGLGRKVTPLVTANLCAEPHLVMLERAELNKALSEQAFGVSGMVSVDAAAQIGQLTGAKVLVAGQVIRGEGRRLVIVANIVGAETGRLFATKVEGSEENLADLTATISRQITQTIRDQRANLTLATDEMKPDRLAEVIKNLDDKNRPSVSIRIKHRGADWYETRVEGELGAILLKAGFTVVSDDAEQRPDIQIVGTGGTTSEGRRGGLRASSYSMTVKIQERRTGTILGFDNQESSATASGKNSAARLAALKTADDLAERILPLLAK